jgi:hypothetical protein
MAEAKDAFSTFRQFARQAVKNAEEQCDMCGEPIPPAHRHLLNLANRELLCACRACTILFDHSAAGGGTRRLVPDRYRYLVDFHMSDAEWESLRIPIHLAFFSYNTAAERVMALYPSPAGPTESLLSFETWQDLERQNPVLRELQPDVEALLVNRVKDTREHYLVPIDECYKLVGIIRTTWRGLSGGQEVRKQIDAFFADLKSRARVERTSHA